MKRKQLQHSDEKLITATIDVMTKNSHRPKPASSAKFETAPKKMAPGKKPLRQIHMQKTTTRMDNTTQTKLKIEENSLVRVTSAPCDSKPGKLKKRLLHSLPPSRSFGNVKSDIDDDALSGTSSAIADRIATFETRMRAAAKSRNHSPRISNTSMKTYTQPSNGLTARNDVGGLW